MAEIRYANLHLSPPSLRVQTSGPVSGPPLGDGWSLVAALPAEQMPVGAGQYAVIVTGKISDLFVNGSTPSQGLVQVCLGSTQQLRLPHLMATHSLTMPLSAQEGIPFQFLLVISASDPDPVMGASFTPDPGLNELVLWGRTYLNADPQTYYSEFTVSDVSWLWFDLARIPSGDAIFTEEATAAGLPITPRNSLRGLSPTIGLTGQTWLHFANVFYEPRQHLGQAPRFRFGVLPEGTPSISVSCTVAIVGGVGVPFGGRFTATAGTFDGSLWQPGAGVRVTGSALGFQGSGGNNSPTGTAQIVFERAVDGSWVTLVGVGSPAFVTEGPVTFGLQSWYVETMIGSSGRWGMNRHPAAISRQQMQQGGFFTHTNTSDLTQVGFDAWEDPTTNPGALYKRWRHLAIRIDPLTDLHVASAQGPSPGGVRLLNNWIDTYLSVERPAPNPGILVEPIVMVHQVARATGQSGAYGSRVTEDSGVSAFTETAFPIADATRGEAVSSVALGRRQFQTLSPAIQWRNHLVGSDTSPPGVQEVYDFHFVAFHPVRDPENITDPPGSPLTPIVLVPGKQGPSPGSLSLPPTAPNANPVEVGENERPRITGGTGYHRSWPVGARPLRRLSVTWGPLTEAEAEAVFAFLRTTPIWGYAPPNGTLQSAMNMTRPVMAPASHRSFAVRVEVAILIWTGA